MTDATCTLHLLGGREPHRGDAADDPAVWIHPRDPGLSLVLGTDKQGGLHSYNMDGSEQQVVADAPRPNNVDVLYGFKLEGRTVDLAVASLQASKKRGTRGVKVWAICGQRPRIPVRRGRARRHLEVRGGA